MMNQRNTRLLRTAAVLVGLLGVLTMSASAMHIAEGYLPVGWAAGWGVVCVPFVVAGFLSIQKKVAQAPKAKILLAMCGAFAFVLSALKIPSITGSCSHPTGVGLGAILFGPMTMAVLGLIVFAVPGPVAGPWRPDHPGGQHLFHGHRRPHRVLGGLQAAAQGKRPGGGGGLRRGPRWATCSPMW